MNIIKKEQLVKKKWSGGTTTELAVYPQDASYSEMNFKWRLSSAEVQVQESEFTHLPEVDRIIMSLKGSLELSHNQDDG